MQELGVFLVRSMEMAETSRKKVYLRGKLMNRAAGALPAVCWEVTKARQEALVPGAVVRVWGEFSKYQDEDQVKVAEVEVVDRASLNLLDLLPGAPVDLGAAWEETRGLLEAVKDPGLRRLCAEILRDAKFVREFREAPGANTMHHAYVGGLMVHTLAVMRLARSLAPAYGVRDLDFVTVAAFIHDLGKVWVYDLFTGFEYTVDGSLRGHIVLGLRHLWPLFEKAGLHPDVERHLEHCLLSHHGQAEWGAVVSPQTLEAHLIHFCDNVDAKLQSVSDVRPDNGGWSSWNKAVGGRVFDAPTQTPGPRPVQGALDLGEASAPGVDVGSVDVNDAMSSLFGPQRD